MPSCGYIVGNMWMYGRKKCVHFSTSTNFVSFTYSSIVNNFELPTCFTPPSPPYFTQAHIVLLERLRAAFPHFPQRLLLEPS